MFDTHLRLKYDDYSASTRVTDFVFVARGRYPLRYVIAMLAQIRRQMGPGCEAI